MDRTPVTPEERAEFEAQLDECWKPRDELMWRLAETIRFAPDDTRRLLRVALEEYQRRYHRSVAHAKRAPMVAALFEAIEEGVEDES